MYDTFFVFRNNYVSEFFLWFYGGWDRVFKLVWTDIYAYIFWTFAFDFSVNIQIIYAFPKNVLKKFKLCDPWACLFRRKLSGHSTIPCFNQIKQMLFFRHLWVEKLFWYSFNGNITQNTLEWQKSFVTVMCLANFQVNRHCYAKMKMVLHPGGHTYPIFPNMFFGMGLSIIHLPRGPFFFSNFQTTLSSRGRLPIKKCMNCNHWPNPLSSHKLLRV